jgi:PAS domain S-box-containing protein
MQLTDGENLHTMVRHAPIGICVLNAQTLEAEMVNDKFLEVAGKPYEAIFGRFYWDAFAEARRYYEAALASVVETGEAYHADEVELMLVRHGREETIYVTFVYAAIKNAEGKIVKIAVWVLENTRQVTELQKIAANEERLRALVTASSDVVYSLSADWRVMRELDGRGFLKDTHGPMTGWRAQNVHPDDMEKVNAAINAAIRAKKIFQLEHRVLRADGTPGWTFSRAVPVLDAQGKILEWFGMASDITERKAMEDDLRKAKEQSEQQKRLYETITSGTPDLMYVFGLDYRFTYANSALLSMWGKTWDNAIGKSLLENGYEPWHAEMHEREIDQVKATKQPVRGEVSFPHATLGKRTYDYILIPVINAQGEVEAVAGTTRDITERKLGEEALQVLNEEMATSNEELVTTNDELLQIQQLLQEETSEKQAAIDRLETSEQQVRSIVAAAPFPIGVYTGREMRILLANQAILNVWGKGGEVIGKTYHEVLPELAGSDIYRQLDKVFMTGEPFHARNQRVELLVGGALQSFYFNYSFTPLHEADGQVYGVMNTAAELTDLVLAKQQVEQSEENLKAMIAQAPVAMCILSGPDHVITVANQLIVELWGKPQAEVMNKPVFEALPDARGQGLEEVMKSVYETGETFYASELPVSLIRHGQSEVVYQSFVYQAYRDAGGDITGVIAITIDVTEQVLARQTIEQSAAELREIKKRLEAELETSRQVQRQKDGFIGMASHELKTPLTSLSALLQVASLKLKNNDDPFLAGAMEKSNVQVKRMTAMINGFLNISRLESGKIHIEQQSFDIEILIKEMITEASLTASMHLIHLVQCAPILVNADREKVGSVISNYLSNAIKYSPKGKNIEITCAMKDNQVIVSVKDEGMGIKPGDLDKIFDRYYRVETSHTQHIAGFGIGLYLSSEIIQRHGGKVWAESESGVGSTFYFSLPLEPDRI